MKATEFTGSVTSFRFLTPTVFETIFETDRELEFQAGQFVSVIIPGAGPKGRDLRRAYSIASAPEKKQIELCVKLVEGGPGTQYLFSLRKGDTFKCVAPYGDFVYESKVGRSACFIATGTGIAPFRSILLSENYKTTPPVSAYCLLGVRTEDELLYQDELSHISNLRFISTVSQPANTSWQGYTGRVTHYLYGLGEDFPWLETEYYMCGHGGMINEIKAYLTGKGVPKGSLHQEIYYK